MEHHPIPMMNFVEKTKGILNENTTVLYGIFGIISDSGFFPTRKLLNEFLLKGNAPCDQDERMDHWKPFELKTKEYSEIKKWWIGLYPNAVESDLEQKSWEDWVQIIIDLE